MSDSNSVIDRARLFATQRHHGQRRKNAARSPYITHPAEVAALVAALGGSASAVAAAWLHDTVEDCPPTSLAELSRLFGAEVAGLVRELTDDKHLPKAERKRRQVVGAPGKSATAALIKLCDKTCNVRSVADTPPADWSMGRRVSYLDWAEMVVGGLRGLPDAASGYFARELHGARDRLAEAGAGTV